jgi:hypothetical protein
MRMLKLSSGETIIAGVIVNNRYELHKPMQVMIVPRPDNQTVVTLLDFMPGCKSETMKMDAAHIMTTCVPDERMTQLYNQVVNPSQIAQPPEKKIVVPGA